MTILEQLREIIEEICGEYCKYAEELNHGKTDKEWEELAEQCGICPLCRIE